MLTYYFSGSLTRAMMDALSSFPGFEPLNVLVSQLDRSGVKQMLKYKEEGLVDKLFIDSGAFSFHTGKAELDLDEYIDYINGLDEYITVFAQVDTIPGKFGMPKTAQDYKESCDKSWENYLYMRTKVKSPKKLTPVFHYGENFDGLRRMLEYRDENGEPIDYIGISPANDTHQNVKDGFLNDVYKIIKASSNPNVKTHLYGMTSITGLQKVPAYSADSISHRHISGYNKIWVPKYGVISLTDKARSSSSKSGMSFIKTADAHALAEVSEYLESLGTDFEECKESSAMRCAVTMHTIRQLVKDYRYDESNEVKYKSLFG